LVIRNIAKNQSRLDFFLSNFQGDNGLNGKPGRNGAPGMQVLQIILCIL